jgi:hypothetical protein
MFQAKHCARQHEGILTTPAQPRPCARQSGDPRPSHLLPLFIDLMMDNPEEDWAMPLYPVIGD